MAFLELQGLTKRFGSQVAVDGLDFAVEQGEFLSLLGPSGCGKTTTLQMIAGFVAPSAGNIVLDGQDLQRVHPSRRGLGMVFQSYALFPHMTTAENVAFGLEMQRVARAERDRRVAETLTLVGLSEFADRYPRRMSGGQQQRVALARALVIRPRILLLDEPLSNLDAKLREEMQIELRQIQRTLGTTTILVTHDQAEAMALSDRVAVMNRGRIEQLAVPYEAYERPANAFVASFLGRTNVLAATGRRDNGALRLTIGPSSWTVPSLEGERFLVTLRPERITFVQDGHAGLPGIVRTSIFQGNHWLYQVETESGLVSVIRQNVGGPAPAEGAHVRLGWAAEDMSVRPMVDRS